MWSIIISPSSKKKEDQFEPFAAKYNTKAEAEKARWKLISIARSTGVFAPCDAETGHEKMVFILKPWSIGQVTKC